MKTTIQHVLLSNLEKQLPTLIAAQQSASKPAGGWLRAVRQAVGLTQATVAKKAGITQQAYAQFERGEARHRGYLKNIELRCAATYPMPGTESESVILKLWAKDSGD